MKNWSNKANIYIILLNIYYSNPIAQILHSQALRDVNLREKKNWGLMEYS